MHLPVVHIGLVQEAFLGSLSGAGSRDVPAGTAPALVEPAVREPPSRKPGVRVAVPAGRQGPRPGSRSRGPAGHVRREAPRGVC